MAGRLSLLASSVALCLAPRHAAGLAAPPPILTAGAEAAETLTFFATADWGGQEVAPYTTPLQLEMANAMGRVSASLHPKFVVSAGGNFLPAGMPGAPRAPCRARRGWAPGRRLRSELLEAPRARAHAQTPAGGAA